MTFLQENKKKYLILLQIYNNKVILINFLCIDSIISNKFITKIKIKFPLLNNCN